MLENQKGIANAKIIILSLLILVLIGGLIYLSTVYPPPKSILTVGSIGGAERAERYRNPDTGQIELDENEVNMFFQSAEWQNISKEPKLLEVFMNKELMEYIRRAINVKQFMNVYAGLENQARANNVQTQEEFNAFMNTAFDSYTLPSNLPLEQAVYLINLQENGQLEQLMSFYSSIGAFNLPENEKFDVVFKAAIFNFFYSNELEQFLAADFESFRTGFSSLSDWINSTDFALFRAQFTNIFDLINSNDFMNHILRFNQDIAGFVINNSEMQYSISQFINNAEMQYSISQFINNSDVQNIINSNIFSRIVATNQDFSILLKAIN